MGFRALARRSGLRLAVSFIVFGACVVRAQDAGLGSPTGLRAILTYGLEFEADTNRSLREESEGAALQFDQRLGLSVRSETRTESFALDTGTTFRSLWQAEDDSLTFDFDEPTLVARYSRESLGSALNISGSFRRRELIFLEPFFLDEDGDTIIDEAGFSSRDGSLTEARLQAGLELNRDGPFSTAYRLRYAMRQYDDNEDPDLFGSERLFLSASGRLRFSAVSSGTATVSHQTYDYDDEPDTEGQTSSVSLRYERALSQTLGVRVSTGYSRREETERIEGEDTTVVDDGLNFGFGLTKEVPLGTIFGDFDRSIGEDGFRNTVSIGRSYELRQSSFSGSVGLTQLEDAPVDFLVRVAYSRDLRDAEFNASLTRAVTRDTVDDEDILTALQLGYAQALGPTRSLAVDLDVARIESIEEDVEDTGFEAAFTASMSQSLTRDWAMRFGYRGQYSDVDDEGEAISNSVFVTLDRAFILRP